MTAISYNKLLDNLTSDQYHGVRGTYSSSQLKTMLENPELFYKTYIERSVERKATGAMDLGTYVHTAILEPDLLETECAVYPGKVRSGKAWTEFQAANSDKVIISITDLEKAQEMIHAVNCSPVALSYINGYKKEASLFIEVYVMVNAEDRIQSEIYFFDNDNCAFRITNNGWLFSPIRDDEKLAIKEFGHRMVLKARADSLNEVKGIVSDVKTTSANPSSEFEMRSTVDSYSYDLSAAYYLDIFSTVQERPFDKFVWIFTSRTAKTSKCWTASEENILIGRSKWRKAIIEIAHYESIGWQFPDELGVLAPSSFQRDWLHTYTE